MHLFQYAKLIPSEQLLWQKRLLKTTAMKNDWQYEQHRRDLISFL